MSESRRGALKVVMASTWVIAVVLQWFDGQAWDVVRLAIGVVFVGALLTFGLGWLSARRRGDGSAQLDRRIVFVACALTGLACAVLVERETGSTNAGTAAFVAFLVPGLAAYGWIATRPAEEHRRRP